MIELFNVSKKLGDNKVIKSVSFSINEGDFFGLVGINGAGKSTLLRLLSGVYTPDEGSILIDGIDINLNPEKKKDIFFLSDDLYYPKYSSLDSLIKFYSTFYEIDLIRFNYLLDKLNFNIKGNISNYSKGMKRQLFIALSLSLKVKYLLLDESFDGLDPLAKIILKEEILKIKDITFIFTSHNLKELEDITSTYAIIDQGEIVSSGSLKEEKKYINKYQLVFDSPKSRNDFLEFNVLDFVKEGSVVKLIIKGDENEVMDNLKKMNPLLLEKIPLDFEGFFIMQSKERGYLK